MKIALIGNICNNMYNIGKALKKHTDIIPHLYIGSKTDIHTNPFLNDPDAKNQQDWVFIDKNWDPALVFKKGSFTFIKKLKNEKYDAILVSDIGVWISPFIKGTKFYFWTTGADITRMPFPFTFNFLYKTPMAKIKAFTMAVIQKWSFKSVNFFLTQPFMPFKYALQKLKIPTGKIEKAYFPLIIDLDIFKYDKDYAKRISEENLKKIEKFKFKIFHPSRLMIKKNEALINAGQWKGNEMLLLGLRRFIDKYRIKDIAVILPKRVHSKDFDLFQIKIIELQLEDNIVWVNGQTEEGFNKEEMVALYSCADLVVDEFGVGWFGSVVVEAASCSRPVICHLDSTVMEQLYPWHPIISVNTPETIADEIAKLYYNKDYFFEKSKSSYAWAKEFHSQENAGKIYAKQLTTLLTK
jgi:glycosyltransferase involved in cell wall biosynthesis